VIEIAGINEETRTNHVRRARNVVEWREKYFHDVLRKYGPDAKYVCECRQALKNFHAFLSAFPCLEISRAFEPLQLLGKHPSYGYGRGLSAFPFQDHTYYWRVKGFRGPLLCTTHPYNMRGATRLKDQETIFKFADEHGFTVEIEPPDVPDIWYPGSTTPIAWSKRGVNWRSLARHGAEVPPPKSCGNICAAEDG
jgi:hypothetical protein